jgi:hypothetical protein
MKILTNTLIVLILASGMVAGQSITYDIAVWDVPDVGSQTEGIIGIPRQQLLCLFEDGHLVAFNNKQYLHLTHNRGATWVDQLDVTAEGNRHDHFVVWADTIYKFGPVLGSNDSGRCMIISTDSGQLNIVHTTGAEFTNYAASDGIILASGMFSGIGPDGMVMLLRSGSTGRTGHYAFSNDRGRTWGGFMPDPVGAYSSNQSRIGLVSVGDSCMALIYDGNNLDIWHFHPSDSSWTLEGNDRFIHGPTQRAFSAAVCNDTVWASITNIDVSEVLVANRQLGSGPIRTDVLWSGPPAFSSSPEWIGYTALQVVEALNTVVCWYVHPDDGSSGGGASRLYLRVWAGGHWAPEQLVSNVPGATNMTAPFTVPASHGNYAYLEFYDSEGVHIAAVQIDGISVVVTRGDIDRAIKQFRDGQITEEEVLNLIDEYVNQN